MTADSSHSNGSFIPVFVVLAVILVISVVSYVLGRLCSRRHHRAREKVHHSTEASEQSHDLGPKEWECRQKPSLDMLDGDIEFGFYMKRTPSAKGAENGGGRRSHNPIITMDTNQKPNLRIMCRHLMELAHAWGRSRKDCPFRVCN